MRELPGDLPARDRVPRLQVAAVELREPRLGRLPAAEEELVGGRVERQEAPEGGLHAEPPRVPLAVARDRQGALEVAEQAQRLGEVEVRVQQVLGAPEALELADRGAQVLRAHRGLARRRRPRGRAPCARTPPRPRRPPPARSRATPRPARAPRRGGAAPTARTPRRRAAARGRRGRRRAAAAAPPGRRRGRRRPRTRAAGRAARRSARRARASDEPSRKASACSHQATAWACSPVWRARSERWPSSSMRSTPRPGSPVRRPQLERGAQVPQRLVEGARVLGFQAGRDRGPQRPLAVAGGEPVHGQLRVRAGVADRLGHRPVHGRALAREQVRVDRLAHDVVAEEERVALAVVDEQVVVDGVAQRGRQLGLAGAGGGAEQRGRRRAADRGRVGQQPPRGLGHAPQPHAQRVGEPRGQLLAARVAVGGQQLLREQRVAAAALVQLGGQRGVGRAAEDPLELRGDALAAERRQLDQRHALVVLQLREHLAHGVGAPELAGAEADRGREPLPPHAAHEEADELARGAVDPVDVLEHHQQRRAAAERAEQQHDRLEQRAPGRSGRAPSRRRPAAPRRGAGRRARARRGPPARARPARPPGAPAARRAAGPPRGRTAARRRRGAGTRRAAPPCPGRERAAPPHAAGGSCRCPPHR